MEQLDKFILYLQELEKSNLTIESYSTDVKLFLNYLESKNIHLEKITKENIKEYILYLYSEKYKSTTINRKLIAINQYLSFNNINVLIRQEKIHTQNFLDNIPNSYDIKKIIDIVNIHRDYRAKSLIYTLYYTGMRISECLQITINDTDKDEIQIRGKGNKLRNIFIPKKLHDIWNEYIPYRIKKSDKLFTGERGGITRQTAYKIFKKYGELANVDIDKLHPHAIRHLYGKRLSDNNLSIDVIADLLGHVNIQTSRIYLRRSKQELLEIINDI